MNEAAQDAAEAAGETAAAISDQVTEMTSGLRANAEESLTGARERLGELEGWMDGADDDMVAAWNDLQADISSAEETLAEQYSRLEGATGDEAAQIQADIHEQTVEIERRVSHMRLQAASDKDAFVAEAQRQHEAALEEIRQIEEGLGDVGDDARGEWNDVLSSLQQQADEAESALDEVMDQSDDAFDAARDDLANTFSGFKADAQSASRKLTRAIGL
jgi:ElaB/YqjD/DUF883 family membrane-anchored ribosome-binding protein